MDQRWEQVRKDSRGVSHDGVGGGGRQRIHSATHCSKITAKQIAAAATPYLVPTADGKEPRSVRLHGRVQDVTNTRRVHRRAWGCLVVFAAAFG
jgi:hypothetical protein